MQYTNKVDFFIFFLHSKARGIRLVIFQGRAFSSTFQPYIANTQLYLQIEQDLQNVDLQNVGSYINTNKQNT